MTFYVLLYDTYCITVPKAWTDFKLSTFKIPRKCKQLTQACMKQLSPCDDWEEKKFHKSFGPYGLLYIYIIFIFCMLQFKIEFIFMSKHVTENYSNARSVEKVIGEMSASDDNIVIREQTKNTL